MAILYVKYRDHLLFRNSDPNLLEPNVREVVGWLEKETHDALYLIYDRSVKRLPFEKRESGLIILKSDILEKKNID